MRFLRNAALAVSALAVAVTPALAYNGLFAAAPVEEPVRRLVEVTEDPGVTTTTAPPVRTVTQDRPPITVTVGEIETQADPISNLPLGVNVPGRETDFTAGSDGPRTLIGSPVGDDGLVQTAVNEVGAQPEVIDAKVVGGSIDLDVAIEVVHKEGFDGMLAEGDQLEWTFTVTNDGDVRLWAPYVYLELHGPADCDHARSMLRPGQHTTCTITTNAVEGSHEAEAWLTSWSIEDYMAADVIKVPFTVSR